MVCLIIALDLLGLCISLYNSVYVHLWIVHCDMLQSLHLLTPQSRVLEKLIVLSVQKFPAFSGT